MDEKSLREAVNRLSTTPHSKQSSSFAYNQAVRQYNSLLQAAKDIYPDRVDIQSMFVYDPPENIYVDEFENSVMRLQAALGTGSHHPAVQVKSSAQTVQEAIDPAIIFVVHGRNEKARAALYAFLRSIGLKPREWSQWVKETGRGSPHIGEILDTAFTKAQAVVVLITPDDEARLQESFRSPHDQLYESQLTGQARPNVLFEAGMAMGRNPNRTILVELGAARPFSDIGGLLTVRLSNDIQDRQELAQRLKTAGCPVDLSGRDWHTAGDFITKIDADDGKLSKQGSSSEHLIYDGRAGIDGFDFRGQEAEIWTGRGKDAKPISPRGHGNLSREGGGVLNIHRTDTEGRFEVWLQRYSYDGKDHSYLPKNMLISGKRKLRISFEAKAVGGEHTLRFVLRIESGLRLAEEAVRVYTNEWGNFEVYLQVDPTHDCQLRIDDERVSIAPSSVQIRNLVVAERKS